MALGDSSGDDADDDKPEEEEGEWRGDFRCERMIGRRQWRCGKEKNKQEAKKSSDYKINT